MKDIKECYINNVYIEDVYAYVHMRHQEISKLEDISSWEFENGIVAGMRAQMNGYTHFCWEAALAGTLWYVYRGMVKEALVFDVITMGILSFLCYPSRIPYICWIILAIIKGFVATSLYYKRIEHAAKKRGLLRRSPHSSLVAKDSMEKAGKPSVCRVLIYIILKCFAAVCLDDIFFTIGCII